MGVTPEDLRALARTSADFARCARFHQLVIEAAGLTENLYAAHVAGLLADGHSIAAIQLDQAACHLAREVA